MPGGAPQHDRCRRQGEPAPPRETEMTTHYPNPALDAEIAYRRGAPQESGPPGRGNRLRGGVAADVRPPGAGGAGTLVRQPPAQPVLSRRARRVATGGDVVPA